MDYGHLNDIVSSIFGEAIVIVRPLGVDETVTGIFDSRYYAVDDGEQGASSLVTTVALRVADAAGVAIDSEIIARGVAYTVADKRPDGQGMIVLELDRA